MASSSSSMELAAKYDKMYNQEEIVFMTTQVAQRVMSATQPARNLCFYYK